MKPLIKSNIPIKTCKICFKTIKPNNLFNISCKNYCFCNDCINELNPKFDIFKEGKYKCLAIYDYDEKVKEYLYQIKGCYDIELAPLFLCRYYRELSIYYSGYIVVPISSWKDDDEIREFNHVVEIFKPLNLKMVNCLYKATKYKQSDQHKEDRKQIKNILKNFFIISGVFYLG